jgi:hypothetical protein
VPKLRNYGASPFNYPSHTATLIAFNLDAKKLWQWAAGFTISLDIYSYLIYMPFRPLSPRVSLMTVFEAGGDKGLLVVSNVGTAIGSAIQIIPSY